MIAPNPVPGSYRDPSAQVFVHGDRIIRRVKGRKAGSFAAIIGSGLVDDLVGRGLLIPTKSVDPSVFDFDDDNGEMVLEHERIPYVSYPYEWTFSLLKAAALHHLEIHLACLERGVTLTDGTAFNIQFRGPEPVFIDALALTPYEDGLPWPGYGQFCRQFLNPLMLWAYAGIPFNDWFRGTLNGISASDLASVLPFWRKLAPATLSHVVLQARLERSSLRNAEAAMKKAKQARISKNGLIGLLGHLQRVISGLTLPGNTDTAWADYETTNPYGETERQAKRDFVARNVGGAAPETLFDLGCNNGEYGFLALESGAGRVIGFDFDPMALEVAFARAREGKSDFLPLVLDATNPSPDLGWFQRERDGFLKRANGDFVLALAFVHHMAIAGNVPLEQLVRWITTIAPAGIIEFVDKGDPMVQRLLALREDVFADYGAGNFETILSKTVAIRDTEEIEGTHRRLFYYEGHA